VQREGLGKLKKSNDLIGNRTCNLPACSIVPQPTMLLRPTSGESECRKSHGKFQNATTLKKISYLSFTHQTVQAYKISLKSKVVMSTVVLI
jgi:hypothetical protein